MRVEPGDAAHTRLLAKWQSEGEPGQFDLINDSYAYERWEVLDRSNENGPTFLLKAACGPTSDGYNTETEVWKGFDWPGPRSGSRVELKDSGLDFTPKGPPQGFRIKVEPQPRDETAVQTS